jgi:hypothetical protein
MPRSARLVLLTVTIGLLAAEDLGRSQGLSQNHLAGLVHHTVAGRRFSTQPGFAIERVNPAATSDSYVAFTFDSRGRLVVSKENDSPRILLDTDADGVYDSEKVVTDRVQNCQGLWFDGPTLYGACAETPPKTEGMAQAGARGGSGPAPAAGIFRLTPIPTAMT